MWEYVHVTAVLTEARRGHCIPGAGVEEDLDVDPLPEQEVLLAAKPSPYPIIFNYVLDLIFRETEAQRGPHGYV